MRKVNMDVISVKEKMASLKGQAVEMNINRGRKKIEKVIATIKDIYPSVFTVKIEGANLQTFSYFDVVCGNVVVEEH